MLGTANLVASLEQNVVYVLRTTGVTYEFHKLLPDAANDCDPTHRYTINFSGKLRSANPETFCSVQLGLVEGTAEPRKFCSRA